MANKINKYEQAIASSKIQSSLHQPDETSSQLFSVHGDRKQKTTWYLSSWESMTDRNVPTNPELVTYKSKTYPYHALHTSLLTTVTPEIKAKEGYEIRFCDDLFINMINEFRLNFNDVEIQFGNRKHLVFEKKLKKDWETISKELGDRETLTSWTDHLKKESISLYLPWCYSLDKSDAFPLYLCGQNDRLDHVVDFNLKLQNLLLIRKSGEDKTLEFSTEYFEVTNGLTEIPIPEMEGLYTTVTKEENEFFAESSDKPKHYFAQSVYYIEDENATQLGKKVLLKVDSKFNQPVHEIYWGAENVTESESEKTQVFHYTVDQENYSPVKLTKIESSIGTILDNKSSYKTERGYPVKQFSRSPETPGFNMWKNSVLQVEDFKKFPPGINFSSGTISVTLEDKNETDFKYLVFSVLVHTKKFVFTAHPKNHEERLHKGATVVQLEDQ